jgi:heterodisulfide reductase subunit B
MKEFKKPDLKAPRFRPEVYSVLNKEFFEKFKKKYPKYKQYSESTLREVIKSFNKTVYETVIDKRDGVQLPETIGWLFIGTCQQSKKKNIDFAKSHKYGITVTNNNFETDGKLAKIFFTSYAPKHKMKNREFWSFVACRDFKRAVAKAYPENWNIYVVVDATTKLRLIYQKAVQQRIVLNNEKKNLQDYNEFDL